MCIPANPDVQHAKLLGRLLRASELWQAALALTGSRLLDLVMLWGGGVVTPLQNKLSLKTLSHEKLFEAFQAKCLCWMNWKDLWASQKVGMDEGSEQLWKE